jgi:hypothetical protein
MTNKMAVSSAFYFISIAWLCVFTIPCSLLYFVVIVALLYNRNTVPFDSSFFTLWINVGIVDMIMTCHAWLFTNSWTLGIWPGSTVTTSYLAFVMFGTVPAHWYFEQVQFIGVTVLSANRFTSVVFPVAHKSVRFNFILILIYFQMTLCRQCGAVIGLKLHLCYHG